MIVISHRFAMVFKWMQNVNVMEFIGKDQNVNRIELELVCVNLSSAGLWVLDQSRDVANGFAYMHGLNLVHGDLKGARIFPCKRFRTDLISIR